MANSVKVRTNSGLITVSTHDIQEYVMGLAQNSKNPTSAPYVAYGPNGAVTGQLSSRQLRAAMSGLGYSKQQIDNVMAGNFGTGGWLSDALQGLAGGLAAVGPAGLGLGDALDAVLPGAGDAAGGAADVAPEAVATGGGILGGITSSALKDLLSKYGSSIVFLPLLEWITTGKNWVRVLEFVGGAAMISIAFRELAQS